MGGQISRTAFDRLLTKTHVEHALIQSDETHNDIPLALATLVFINGTPTQLESIYNSKRIGLQPWPLSPERITNEAMAVKCLGDDRFQRAYMDYFSMENGRLRGNSKALAMSHLLSDTYPMIYGLFGGFGQALVFLSDAIELQSAILLVESLVLAAVDWNEAIYKLLKHPQLSTTADESLPPETIISRIAYDGRLGGVMKSGPGYHRVSNILSNENVRRALVDYIHSLDMRNLPRLLTQMARLSVLLLCAAHKPGRPAFDCYLSSLPTFIHSLRVLLDSFQDHPHKTILVHGVWLLIILSYVTQLRPIISEGLITATEVSQEDMSWDRIFSDLQQQPEAVHGKYRDSSLLRTLRSLQQLGGALGADERFYLQAAWKLKREWQQWTGLGNDREESLNIRL